MIMLRLDPRLVMGATLFATPRLKGGGIDLPGLGIVVFVILLVVVGLVLGRHSRPGPSDPSDGDGWGKGPPGPESPGPDRPRGGIPLDDAEPARVRLRGPARLADKLPARVRRPAREPDRTPTPTRIRS
jgi:hypothetical protein